MLVVFLLVSLEYHPNRGTLNKDDHSIIGINH